MVRRCRDVGNGRFSKKTIDYSAHFTFALSRVSAPSQSLSLVHIFCICRIFDISVFIMFMFKIMGFLTILVVYSLLLVLALGIGKMVLVVGGVEPGDGSYFVCYIKPNVILVQCFINANKFAPLEFTRKMKHNLQNLRAAYLEFLAAAAWAASSMVGVP